MILQAFAPNVLATDAMQPYVGFAPTIPYKPLQTLPLSNLLAAAGNLLSMRPAPNIAFEQALDYINEQLRTQTLSFLMAIGINLPVEAVSFTDVALYQNVNGPYSVSDTPILLAFVK